MWLSMTLFLGITDLPLSAATSEVCLPTPAWAVIVTAFGVLWRSRERLVQGMADRLDAFEKQVLSTYLANRHPADGGDSTE